MKRNLMLFLCCSLVLVFSGCRQKGTEKITLSAEYPAYQNLSEMSSKADMVIQGEITGSKFQMLDIGIDPKSNDPKLNPGGKIDHTKLPYTVYDVKVSEVFKGKAEKGDTIQLKQLGGDDGKKQYVCAETRSFKAKSDYIFFLSVFNGSPASLINPTQGVYDVEDGKIAADTKNPVKIEGFQQLRSIE